MEPGQILDPQRVTGERWALLEEKTVQSLCCLSSPDLMEPGNWRVFILRLRRGFDSEMHQGLFCNIEVAGRVDPCNKRWPPLCMSRLLVSADLRPARWVLSFKLPRLAGMHFDFLSSVFYCSFPNLFVSPHLNIYFRISLIFFSSASFIFEWASGRHWWNSIPILLIHFKVRTLIDCMPLCHIKRLLFGIARSSLMLPISYGPGMMNIWFVWYFIHN